MSRLLNVGPGEIADRLTILGLKIAHGTEKGVDVKHWRDERNALLVKVQPSIDSRWVEHALELAAVNALLWQAEDDLRTLRKDLQQTQQVPGSSYASLLQSAGEVAVQAQALNDRRAELVAQINAAVGETAREKLTT